MSTPSDGNPWAQPGSSTGPSGGPADQSRPAPSGYGTPSSPSYGKYGQGQALPVPPAPPAPPSGPQWGQPGYTPPQQQWTATGGPTEVKLVGGLQSALLALSAITGVSQVVAAAMAPNQHDAFVDAMNGVTSTQPGSSGYDAFSSIALLVEVAVWVVACVWLTRVRQNAMVLAPRQPRRSEVWIWLGWIVPVVNFWFPKQIVDDVIAGTAQATGKPPLRTGFWWAAWLSSTLAGVVLLVAGFFPPNDSVHLVLVVVNAVVVAIGLVLWVRIVRWVSVSQDARAEKPAVVTLGQ